LSRSQAIPTILIPKAPFASRACARRSPPTRISDRLLTPLKRAGDRGEGAWQEVSWDEALSEIAQRLGEVKQRFGPLSICGAVSNQYGSRGVAMALTMRSSRLAELHDQPGPVSGLAGEQRPR
jgi:anaerobic selenocysteine-containing dehydrogenase